MDARVALREWCIERAIEIQKAGIVPVIRSSNEVISIAKKLELYIYQEK